MEYERALWILDHLWDFVTDELGTEYVIQELEANYSTKLTDFEKKYLNRGHGGMSYDY